MAQTHRPARAVARLVALAARAAVILLATPALNLADVPAARTAAVPTHDGPANMPGIRNFGRVTPMLYRGGDFMPNGVESIVHLGVRTVISLRTHSRHGEPDSCAAHGIAYHLFPMLSASTPDSAAMDSVLDIIRNAKAPVYIHCTAGELRTGTVCALYRVRVQGWSRDRAWAEQKAYGFGPADHHPALIHFVYGESFTPPQ